MAEEEIVLLVRFPGRPAEALKQGAERSGTWYNATRGARLHALVLLRNGWIVGSPHLPETLAARPRVQAPTKAPKKR